LGSGGGRQFLAPNSLGKARQNTVKSRKARESTVMHGDARESTGNIKFSALEGVSRREISQESVILPSQGHQQQRQHNLLESCRIFKSSTSIERFRRDLSIDVANSLEGQGLCHSFS
jgi:GTPase